MDDALDQDSAAAAPGDASNGAPAFAILVENFIGFPNVCFDDGRNTSGAILIKEQVKRPISALIVHTPVIPSVQEMPEHPTIPIAPRGPFETADDAAFAWANHIHSTSLFTRHEHGVIIYLTAPGEYYLTRTASGSPHCIDEMNDLVDEVPPGATKVAGVHTHLFGNDYSAEDITWGCFWPMDMYISAPTTWGCRTSFYLRRYTASTSSNDVLGAVSLRPLSESERAALTAIYEASWNAHLPCYRSECPPSGGWPTRPWPAQ